MSRYFVQDSELTSVANAIRTKGGTSTALSWPSEYVQAINDIPTGAEGVVRLDDDVKLYTTLTITADPVHSDLLHIGG